MSLTWVLFKQFKERFLKCVHKTKQRKIEKKNVRICIGMQRKTTICLWVHVKYAATGYTKSICLTQLRLITTIREVDNVRPFQLRTTYKMINKFLWYMNQSALFLSHQTQRRAIVPRPKHHIKSDEKKS